MSGSPDTDHIAATRIEPNRLVAIGDGEVVPLLLQIFAGPFGMKLSIFGRMFNRFREIGDGARPVVHGTVSDRPAAIPRSHVRPEFYRPRKFINGIARVSVPQGFVPAVEMLLGQSRNPVGGHRVTQMKIVRSTLHPNQRMDGCRSGIEKTPPDFGLRRIRWGRNREEAESLTIMTDSQKSVNATSESTAASS